MRLAGLALGSNLGDRLGNLKVARQRLEAMHEGGPEAFRVSSVYETEPVGCGPGAAAFLNAVVALRTSRSPRDLLAAAQAIERDLGRPSRRPKNAPRTIDVDLLFLDDTAWADAVLELPHPRLLQRRFVLTPLAEICPDLRLPGETRTMRECLDALAGPEPPPARRSPPGW